jgi:hypothetical protein
MPLIAVVKGTIFIPLPTDLFQSPYYANESLRKGLFAIGTNKKTAAFKSGGFFKNLFSTHSWGRSILERSLHISCLA